MDDKIDTLFFDSQGVWKNFRQAVEALDKKHEEMWKRLDGTYQIGPDN